LHNRDQSEKRGSEKGRVKERVRTLTLSGRSETVVRIPVEFEENQTEGLIEKHELQDGIFLTSSLTMVKDGYTVTSMLNTNEQEVIIPEPKVKLEQIVRSPIDATETSKNIQNRGNEVLGKL
jgi:hypothetical protein